MHSENAKFVAATAIWYHRHKRSRVVLSLVEMQFVQSTDRTSEKR